MLKVKSNQYNEQQAVTNIMNSDSMVDSGQ